MRLLPLLLVVAATAATSARAALPPIIGYEGELFVSGEAFDGQVDVQVSLFASENAAEDDALFVDSFLVDVVAGRFFVAIGSREALSSDVRKSDALFLGLAVDGTPLSGRQQLLPVSQALYAEEALVADDARGLNVLSSADENTFATVENNSGGPNAAGVFLARSDVAQMTAIAHGSGRTLSRWGLTLGGFSEILQVAGNGLAIGTLQDDPLVLGTNSLARVTIRQGGNVGVGTDAPQSKLHVSGGDVRVSGGSFIDDGVTLNVPDYVFDPARPPRDLSALEEYVRAHRHLPGVPSAAEINENGLPLAKTQMAMLEILEELTLQSIAQQKRITELEKKLEAATSSPASPARGSRRAAAAP